MSAEGYRVQAAEPPEGLEGEALAIWWREERRRLRLQMYQLADHLFGDSDVPPPSQREFH